jgi:hypothetical protein
MENSTRHLKHIDQMPNYLIKMLLANHRENIYD